MRFRWRKQNWKGKRRWFRDIPCKPLGSYYNVYENLMMLSTLGITRSSDFPLHFSIFIPLMLFAAIVTELTAPWMLRLAVVFAILSFLLLLYGMLLFFLATATNRAEKYRHVLAAHIIAGGRRPYDSATGLNYKQIKRLQRIAEVEQNSADWRNSILEITLLGIIGIALTRITDISLIAMTGPIDVESESVSGLYQSAIPSWFNNPLLLAVSISFWLWIGLKLYDYLFNFLVREPANRVVLTALIEAEALLDDNQLSERESISLEEKQYLSEFLGCSIVPSGKSRFRGFSWFCEPDGQKYTLVLLGFPEKFTKLRNTVNNFRLLFSRDNEDIEK